MTIIIIIFYNWCYFWKLLANYCGEPPAVQNGYISDSNGVVFGSYVTFTCFPGFSLQGSPNITCQDSGWTRRPQCACKFGQILSNFTGKIFMWKLCEFHIKCCFWMNFTWKYHVKFTWNEIRMNFKHSDFACVAFPCIKSLSSKESNFDS